MLLNTKQKEILDAINTTFNTPKKFLAPRIKKSFYVYGKTGCGKTTIMDTFFDGIPFEDKINMHFHDYFIDISRLLQKYPLPKLVKRISSKISLICFDEFNIDNITDGLLLFQLFENLLKNNVSIILTSNFAPDKLFLHGFNRERIFPAFSNFINQNMNVEFLDLEVDYRTDLAKKVEEIAFYDNRAFHSKIQFFHAQDEYKGNISHDKIEHTHSKIAIFSHETLFKKPISTAQLIHIARNHHLICLQNLPKFTQDNEDEAIRFRNFIDILYLRNINILLHLKEGGDLSNLFSADLLGKIEYKRAISRLYEMSWEEYIYDTTKRKKREWADKARQFFEHL